MNEQKLFGIVIFSWKEWDEIDTNCSQFYNVEFPFESMNRYNGMDTSFSDEGELSITDKSGNIVWEGYVCQIPEFMSIVDMKFGGNSEKGEKH